MQGEKEKKKSFLILAVLCSLCNISAASPRTELDHGSETANNTWPPGNSWKFLTVLEERITGLMT